MMFTRGWTDNDCASLFTWGWIAPSAVAAVISVTGRRVARKVKEKVIDTHALMVEQIQMDERDLVSVVVAIVRAI